MQCEIKQYWDLNDDDVQAVYDHAVDEKLLDRVVYDAGLNRKMFPLFVRRAECFCAVRSGGNPAGFFYLSHFEGATARLHLALAAKPSADRDALVCRVLDWCFETFDFKSLLIITPADDQDASKLWTSLGADRLAEVPGLCWLEKKKKNVTGNLFLLHPNYIPPTTVGVCCRTVIPDKGSSTQNEIVR